MMICPMMSGLDPGSESPFVIHATCKMEDCAWWNGGENDCAVCVIADELVKRRVVEEVERYREEILSKYRKDEA